MAADDTSHQDPEQWAVSPTQAGAGPASEGPIEDLAHFELRWSRELEDVADAADRLRHYGVAGDVAVRAAEAEASGAWDFVRTWLRRLADDMRHGRLPPPLPPNLERAAQRAVRLLLQREQESLTALHEALASQQDLLDFVRQSPRASGALRDLGRLMAAFRGSGILSLENTDLIADLITLDEALTRRSRQMLTTVPDHLRISREDLLRWADSGTGYEFPRLVRRLILETAEGVDRAHFPAGVGASSGDWDGFVHATIGNAFVPEGYSGWELSVEQHSNRKAEDDYGKRSGALEASAAREITYIQLICRPWTKARTFAAGHTAEGHWKEVRGYNVDDLEMWLEHAPSTTIWLAEQLERPVFSIRTAEQWWEAWLSSTSVPLGSTVVLAGRDSQASELATRVSSPGLTTIGGDVRLEELKAFIAAALSDRSSGPGDSLHRALFVDDRDEARKLLDRPGQLVVVVPGQAFAHDLPRTFGHHVVVPVLGSDRVDIVLPRVSPQLVAQALQAEGLTQREASDFGALARRSLLALRRRLAVQPILHRPKWASPGADIVRRRVLLANAWNQTKAGDQDAISRLVGQPYQELEDELRTLAGDPDDPMVAILDERWHVVSPMDTWLLLGPQLSTADLEAFRSLALSVLLEPDPMHALPEEERWQASLDGVTQRYSTELMAGVADSLALLGTVDELVQVSQGQTGATVAASIVWEALNAANHDRSSATWITLAPRLPLLAEAAPSAVLSALQVALGDDSPFAVDVFADKDPGRFGSPPPSPHTHVLWALETLAWSTEHFDASISLLARLAELDPGGQWANRPSSSLSDIFCPWHPNTSAPLEQRLATLQRLRRQHPAVAWDLLVSMLPNPHSFQVAHHGPVYRGWRAAEPVVKRSEYAKAVEEVAHAALDEVGHDPERWKAFIGRVSDLPPQLRAQARARLRELASESAFGDAQEAVWKELKGLISQHREYADARWALPIEELDELTAVADALAPTTPRKRHAWLFGEGMITLGDIQRRDDYRAYEEEVRKRRTEAVREILQADGVDELIQFGLECPVPGQVGGALARAAGGEFDERVLSLLVSDAGPSVDFAFGYFGERFRSEGWPWLDELIATNASLSPTAVSRLLRSSWNASEASDRADSLGADVAREYWCEFSYLGLGADFRDAPTVSGRLVEVGRSAAALALLALYARQGVDIRYAEAIAAAFEALMAAPDDPELIQLSRYNIDTLLKILAENRHEVGIGRAARIEWFFLPLLGYIPDARTLHSTLAEDPKFFVDVVSMIFRSKSEARRHETPTAQEKAAAENAFRLLSSWSICPGTDESGAVNSEQLRDWVTEARRLLETAGLVEVGDEQIGQALAASQVGDDGLSPSEPVREVLEDLRNDAIERGLEIRLFNNRGVVARSLDEGGRQEWELVEDYRSRALQLMPRWPRTAAIYRRLADTYAAHARREDARAERRSRGLEW